MELLQLRYFQAVARSEHISHAAAQLHVAQPSLSRTIARLEGELGVPLFDRRGRRIRLNRFGAALLRRVDRALAELDHARAELADAAGLEHGSVAVAAETLLTLTEVLSAFLAEHPGVNFRLHQSSPKAMLRQLRTSEVDLCLSSQPLDDPAISITELRREEVLLATPAGHPLAARRRVDVAALREHPFITTRPGHWLRELAERILADADPRPPIACETDEPAAIRPLIAAGLGIGLLPSQSRQATPQPPVAWLHLNTPHASRMLRLAWCKDAYLSDAARSFRELAVRQLGARDKAPETASSPAVARAHTSS